MNDTGKYVNFYELNGSLGPSELIMLLGAISVVVEFFFFSLSYDYLEVYQPFLYYMERDPFIFFMGRESGGLTYQSLIYFNICLGRL